MPNEFWSGENAREFFDVESELRTTLAHSYICKAIADSGAQTVLEIGCGEGDLAIRLAKNDLAVTACDPSDRSIDEANRRAIAQSVSVQFKPIEEILDQSLKFDCVVLSFVLVTIPTRAEALKVFADAAKLLTLDGRVLFVDTHPCFRDQNFSSFRTQFSNLNYNDEYRPFSVTVTDTQDESKSSTFIDFHKSLNEIFSMFSASSLKCVSIEELYDKSGNASMSDYAMGRLNGFVPPFIFIEGAL